MPKFKPILFLFAIALVANCQQENQNKESGSIEQGASDRQSCYYRAEVFWANKNEPSPSTRKTLIDVMFETSKSFDFGGASYSGANPSYIYLELRKPCLNSKRKAYLFFESYKQNLYKKPLPIEKIGNPKPISQMALESYDQIPD